MSAECTSSERPRVSVIIAAYESGPFIAECLGALSLQTFHDFETVVVNSSPEEETGRIVANFPGVRFHQSKVRLLPHAARNAGVAMARGEVLVFTDADCCPAPDWLEKLMQAHAAGREAVCGVIDSHVQTISGIAMYFVKYMPYLRGLPARTVDIGASGNFMISRRLWKEAGPFDGSIFAGDALLSWRLRRAGYPVYFSPDAIVIDRDEKLPSAFFRTRFERGREFGLVRAEFEAWSSMRRLIHVVMAPLAALRVLISAFTLAWQAGVTNTFILTLPLQFIAHLCWCLGEAAGYLARRSGRV